jgi:ABC-2 type transport system permease protein
MTLPYVSLWQARFRALLQYRAAALAGIATQLFWGLLRVTIFTAFFQSTTLAQPMNLRDTITYLWLTQAFLLLTFTYSDGDVRTQIRSGAVAYELLRPLDLYALWFTRSLASKTAPLMLRAVPQLILAGLFFGLQAPASLASALAWIAATVIAILLAAALSLLVTITYLWTISGDGMNRLMPALVFLFSGSLVPIPLMPDALQTLLYALPFRALVDTPFRLYMGDIPPEQAGIALAHGAFWLLICVMVGRGLLSIGTRRLVIQGG